MSAEVGVYLAVGGYVFGYPLVGTDDGAVADGDSAEDGGVAVDDDIIADDGMTCYALDGVAILVEREGESPEGYPLIKFHAVAYDTGGAYHYASAVVNGEMTAYLSGRMNVDACLGVSQFGYHTGYEGHTQFVELVGKAVVAQGADDGVAGDNLAKRGSGRVTLVGSLDISGEHLADAWQALYEQSGDEDSLLAYGSDIHLAVFFPEIEAESGDYLFLQQAVEFLERHANVEVEGILTYLALSEVTREEYLACQLYDFFQCTVRG